MHSQVLIKGKLNENLKKDINDLIIFVTYPKLYLNCVLKNTSKIVDSNLYCYSKIIINGEILIENQIIYNKNYSENLLIVNTITLYQNYEIIKDYKLNYKQNFTDFNKFINNFNNSYRNLYYILLILFISLKSLFYVNNCRRKKLIFKLIK